MKKTYRMQRGFISFLFIDFFLILWFFFSKLYPLIVEQTTIIQLPHIESNIFLVPIGLMAAGLFVSWSIRNKLWFGPLFSVHYYSLIKRMRRNLKDARFEDEREFDNCLVRLPKIKIEFDDNHARKSGKVFIQNSIKFDKKLEDMRIDAALEGYVSERQYLSKDRNWYIYEFYAVDSQKQLEIKSASDLIEWSNKTADDYALRLDERVTVPFHHQGLVGQTGSGKSFFIQMLVEQVLSKKVNHELFIIDPKRTDVYQMAKRTLGDERTADKTNAIELIKQFHERMKKRQDELQDYFISNRNKTYKDAGLPALILLIDEFGALRESWKTLAKKERDEVDSILSDVAFMGRQLGCILWVATQQMNAQTMPTAIREQLVLKIALGDSDEQTYRTLFSSGVNIPPVQFTAGQGIYSYPGLASADKPRLLIVPYCSFLNGST
ncbi:FtsK/SpoIIIE domain-containing protein [Enterococcus lactis]|uniref:FtsK/SpoIIIE domain-containing protein n=1 Tax=Enterococcus lactis TaxID=357441 RepID=UPI0022F2A6B9|nr:FtsK/SpoIIIE domain-containing protein [Enterococcus lactis]MDA5328269.1 FtsK/SpoIIIE domain-containing protein [Enterococcus lactis]